MWEHAACPGSFIEPIAVSTVSVIWARARSTWAAADTDNGPSHPPRPPPDIFSFASTTANLGHHC